MDCEMTLPVLKNDRKTCTTLHISHLSDQFLVKPGFEPSTQTWINFHHLGFPYSLHINLDLYVGKNRNIFKNGNADPYNLRLSLSAECCAENVLVIAEKADRLFFTGYRPQVHELGKKLRDRPMTSHVGVVVEC